MKKIVRKALAGLALVTLSAWGQTQANCPVPPQLDAARMSELQAQARDRGMLWRVEKDGRTSWLYGTIHAARIDWAMPGPSVVRAIASSDVVAVELDVTDPSVTSVLMQPADASIATRVLDAGRRERILRQATKSCTPLPMLQKMRPSMQVLTLGMMQARHDGLYPEFGVDMVLTGFAQAAGKRLVSLETAAQQLAMLAPESDEDERELVDASLQDLESGKASAQLRRLAGLWSEGDEKLLATFPQWCECLDTPLERRLYKRINDDRNPAMADKLVALHIQGSRFFAAVGLLHMSGAQALPDLLRARGFTVQRVRFKPTGS